MMTIKVDKEIVQVDYGTQIDKWLDIIEIDLKKTITDEKLEFYYSFGSFLPKVKNKEEFYLNMWEETAQMVWSDRIKYELAKIRIDLTLKLGKFSISDRMPKNYIPSLVINLVTEITKLKMMFECELNNIEKVKESIPPLDKDYFDMDSVRELLKLFLGNNSQQYDIDQILDKISQNGIDSLTPSEKDFLNKKSKEL